MATQSKSVGILGLGTYVPERVLTNGELARMVETTDEWIVSRTGIRERRISAPDQMTSDLAALAAREALADAELEPDQIDLILCCTSTPDYISPATACLVQSKLGMRRQCPAFDLLAACTGFVYGCTTGAAYIQAGFAERVLVIGAEAFSRIVDYRDRSTCVLFGDGAGAVVLANCGPERGLIGQSMGADGSGAELIVIPTDAPLEPVASATINAERAFLTMQGNEVYKFATRILGPTIEQALRNTGNGLQPADLDLIVPHQANRRIIEVAAKKLDVPVDRFVINLEKYGNTSAASIPLALADARADGRLREGSLVAFVAFGGGLTYGASIWRW